jgi:hypothetical protein
MELGFEGKSREIGKCQCGVLSFLLDEIELGVGCLGKQGRHERRLLETELRSA